MLVRLDQICTYLRGQTTTLGSVVSDRIYFGEPMREQTGPYIILNSISQVIDNPVSKQALIEARIVGHDENDTKKTLVGIAEMLNSALLTTETNKIYDLGGFEVYKIVEGSEMRMFVDDKNRNLLIKDYILYFLN